MANQSSETLIVSNDNGHEHLFTSSSSSLVSCESNSSNLHKIDISHGIDSVKLEELLKHAHTSLGDEHYDQESNHYHVIKHSVQAQLSLPEQVDQMYQATKLHSFGRDNDDVRDYPQHHLNYDGSIGGSTRSAITTSGSSLGSLSSGNYESTYPPFFPEHYSEGEQQSHQNQPVLTISHQHEQEPNYSRLPKMSRPVRVTLSASNKNYQAARYKTELCLHFREHNTCPHGDMCLFAHGLSELRPYRGRHPKHKTQPCRSFHQTGFCNYGYRCSYIHLESPETIKYLRGLNINKAQEEGCTNTKPVKCEIGLNTRDRVQFKHK